MFIEKGTESKKRNVFSLRNSRKDYIYCLAILKMLWWKNKERASFSALDCTTDENASPGKTVSAYPSSQGGAVQQQRRWITVWFFDSRSHGSHKYTSVNPSVGGLDTRASQWNVNNCTGTRTTNQNKEKKWTKTYLRVWIHVYLQVPPTTTINLKDKQTYWYINNVTV